MPSLPDCPIHVFMLEELPTLDQALDWKGGVTHQLTML